jgi:hypothetical protein
LDKIREPKLRIQLAEIGQNRLKAFPNLSKFGVLDKDIPNSWTYPKYN